MAYHAGACGAVGEATGDEGAWSYARVAVVVAQASGLAFAVGVLGDVVVGVAVEEACVEDSADRVAADWEP